MASQLTSLALRVSVFLPINSGISGPGSMDATETWRGMTMDGNQFFERLEQFADRTAIVWRDRCYTYADLLDRVHQWRDELAQRGVDRGEAVAFSGDFSPGTTSLLLALVAGGNIAIPLTASVLSPDEQRMRSVYAWSVIEFADDDSWQFRSRSPVVKHPLLDDLREAGAAGLVLFSSGSTGKAKASLHNVHKLLAQFKEPKRAFRMLAFLLLDHMGGVNTLFSVLCNGGTAVTVAQRTAEAVCRAVQQHRIELLPATPTFLNMLLISEAHRRWDLSSVKYMSYGTEPMPPATLDALHEAFPGVQLRQLYGLTELGILPTKTHASDGLKIRLGGQGCDVKIVDGILWIKADTAMLGYLNAPSPFDEQGWFNTGDAVVEEDGYLRVLGRKSELINVGGEKVFPAEVENTILQLDNVRDVAVRSAPNPITGNVVVARVTLKREEDPAAFKRRLRRHCKERLASFKVPALVEITDEELHGDRFKKIRRVRPSAQEERKAA